MTHTVVVLLHATISTIKNRSFKSLKRNVVVVEIKIIVTSPTPTQQHIHQQVNPGWRVPE